MIQKIKQFQYKMQENKIFCMTMTLFGILFPCIHFVAYYFSISLLGNLLWIGFYGILGNMFLFHQNKIVRLILLMINIVILLSIYLISVIAGWYGIFSVLFSPLIPLGGFWITLFAPSYPFVL